jgi:rhodanese-related sulfurtransferase
MANATFDTAAVRRLLDDGADVRVIDVRTGGEFETAHIPGSYNVPLDTLGEHREEIRRHVSETVVLVCQSGNRASQAERKLAEIGMSNVHVLEGGIAAWQAGGGPVNRGRQRWSLERQVRLVAGLIVLLAVTASAAVPPLKWLAGFVGAGLTFAAVSNTCAMGTVLGKLSYNRGGSCDTDLIVAQLTGGAPARSDAA